MNRLKTIWTPKDVERLKEIAGQDAQHLQKAFPDRTLCSIENAFVRYKIPYRGAYAWKAWSDEDLRVLHNGVYDINTVALRLNRSYHACLGKAQAMGYISEADIRHKSNEKLKKEIITTGRKETEAELTDIETRLQTCSLDEAHELINRRNILSIRLQSFATDMKMIRLQERN